MALQTGTNQNENSEPTKIEEISGVAGATDLTDVTPKEEETTFTSAGNLFNSPIDPPTKKTSSPMREGEAAARRAVNGIDNTVGHDINNATPVASEAMGFLDSMAAHAPRDTRISRPIDQSVDFEKYKDYLTSNSFYFDGDSNLDKARAENQSNWAQARNATARTLLNVVPEAIKQTANAFDFEDWSKAEAETGNWVSDAMTSAQESVKDVLPIYRENPGQALDVGDFAYWMETGDSLVTSIGGFALSGYALGGGVSVLSKGASGLAKIGALVADSVKNTRSFRTALGAIEARGTGEAVRGLTLNYLMNRSESLGIAAETYATVYEREYNKAIVEGKSNEEAKTTAKRFAAEGAAGSMKFNALNMILNTTSSNLFLKSAKVSSLIKKEGIGTAIGEVGKEGLEEYVNDLGQLYGEGLNTEAPLTFKAAMQRLGTAEGLESPILGFIGGAGQPALTKAGKYIQTTDNSSYVRNFNQYLLDNPITATNKEETLQKAVAYAQTQSDKDAKIGFFTNTANAGGQRTSTAQQLESLYVAQQVALSDYEKADKASNMNDVVNMSISSEFSVNLMNELSSDPNISPEQKDILLERALLSHQAYKAMSVGTMSELKDVYRTYSNMEAKEATDRGLLKDEVEGTPEHYKTKAKRALQTLDAYEANYNVSKGFVNSSEVYKSLNDIHFATRTVKEASDKYNDKAAELDTLSRELFESEGDTEALKFYESVQASNRIAIHPKLKGTKIDEEIQDERKAVKVAKQNKLNSVVNFQTITSSTYTKNLNDLVKLYKNKQIAEANKTKATKTFSEGFKNVFTSKAKTTSAKANKTKNTSTTGGSNPNTTTPPATNTASAIAKAKAANNANANKGTVTPPPAPPPPAPPVKTPNTNVKNPSVFTFDTSNITASTTMQMFVDGDTKKINGILNSGDSIETKIAKLEQDVENKIKYDRVGAKNLAPDGTEVIDSLIAKIQDKISELQNELVSLSPEVRESKEAYEALVTDFGLDLEEERLLSTDIVDEDGNAIENTKAIVDSKYDIYSSILEQMKNRGVDTSNFEDVMFDFKSILGDRLTQSEFNSLQGLYNFTNNTNHNSSYKEIFGTLGEIDNDIDTANRIAKVTLPEGRFTYDLDVESQMALQAERQAIIVENPNAEVKGLAFPIYNEEGGNKIAYLAQQYSKVARQEVNKDGETYTLVDKVTTTGLLNVDLDSKTLEPDFFNVNDVITFMPLESFVNEDGETIMADTLPVSEKPVGLIINGELVQGLFLHTTSWINATNINNTSEHIEQDRLSLLALRTKIFNGESVTAKITEVSTGAPIKNPNNSSRTFLSEFATHPVGIIRNGLLETSSGIIEVPEYLSFPEGSVVIKVGDYFHYGSRVGLFAPMRQAIITGIRAFATGVESEGTKYLKQNQGLDATTSKGLEGYVRQLVNVSPVKVGESYPTNLEEFITALNTRPETEVYVNFIKGDLYIGRGQGLDVIQISQKGYAHDTRSLDVLLNEIEGLLQDSYANVDLPSLKTNESIVIIGEAGITRTFDTYDEYVKQVSTSIYGSIDLPSGTNITTIQKRVSFETETIDAESNPKKKRAYKKRETKKAPIVIDNPTGTQTTIEFNTTVAADSIIDDITDDFSPDVIDATTANTNEIAYNLKAINILSTDKAKQIFEKGIKNNWDLNKILTELQIPKEQKQLILDKGITSREDIITSLLAENSFVVEINTATRLTTTVENPFDHTEPMNTDYYSNLTVPGGTDYTENEIATPAITPSIKGHAEFATINGIGWFRSDDKLDNAEDYTYEDYKYDENGNPSKVVIPLMVGGTETKTRRILEIQSDLFQKGRDKEDLITVEQFENSNDVSYEHTETGEIISGEDLFYGGYTEVEKSKYKIKPFDNEQNKDTNKNKFLQLLNKDSNWVNFFVKSIIQDSAKKGYEKILFPSGNTASKVEGHTTLEEFKKQKEDRIKELEFTIEKTNNKEFIDRSRENLFYSDDVTDEQIKKELTTDYNREIAQLKQELEQVEGPGGFGALKPIYNFYENTLTNILNKTYGKNNVKLITDEYGNTWNEVTIENVPTTVDLSPTVEEPLISPSLIPGLSNKLQQIIIQDIVLDYYGLLIDATKSKNKVSKLEDFYANKVAEFDEVVLKLEKQNYAGLIKVRQQVEIIKANKAKILEIARQNLTKQLGVRVNEGNLELDNTNDSTASNDEEIDAPDGIPAEDASERSRIYDANEFGIDPKLSMSNSIRHMLYGIVDAQLGFKEEIVREVVDGVEQERVVRVASINYRKVPLQVPVYVNANEVYEDLVKLFAKSSINVGMDVEGFIPDVNSKLHPKIQVAIEILKSKYTIKPYYSNVVDKLENMDMETQLNFIRAFNKNVTDHIKVIEYLDKDGQSLSLKIIKNSTQNAVNNLKQKWNINLKAISGYVPNDDYMTLNPVIYQAFTNSYNKIKGDTDLHTYENFKNMFSVIGITLSNAAFEKLRAGVFVGGKPKNLNQQFEHTQGYFNRIKKQVDYIMNGGPNGTAIDVNLLYQDKVFTEFANFLMDFDKSVFNNSYTNGNGDTIYGVTNNRYFMERFIGLKNNLKLLKNLKNNKFSSKSAWLNNLYNENNGAINKGDFHDTFSYSTLDSYTVRETNKSKMVDTLTRVEMVKLGISLFMNKGRNILNNTIPISKFIIPALSDKTNLFVVEAQGRFYSLNNNTLLGTDLNFLRSQLFEGEFLRIIEAQAKGPIGVNGYDIGSNKFLLFPLFNDIEGLFNEGRINVDALNDPIIVARINEVIMDYIITGSTDVYNDWQAMKLLKPGKIDESTGITIYSEKMDFMDSNYAKFASKHVRQTMEEGKSLALNYHINYLVANANMQQLIFNDPAYYYKKANEEKGTTDIQETFDNATKRYAAVNGGKDDFIFPAGSTFDVLSIQDANVVSSRHDYLESLWAGHPDFVETMKSYSNMTSGDAQEYTSLEEHLDRMIYGNMISEETGKRVLKTYKETGSVSKEDLGRILIPFKPLYFNTYPGTDGIMRTLYIKTSSLPLIKELTKGTQLDALREYLDNPKTTPKVAVFESGIKAGKPTKSLALFDEKGNLDAKALKGNLNAHIITKIPREGHGNQQANPDKSLKSVVNDGTQQAKLLFTNILDVLGFKNPFAVKGEENKTISGRELATMYLNRYEDRFKKQYDKLVKELKIDANGNIGNMAKLQKLLVDEAVSRGWTFNESSSFELDDTGLNFKIPLWMSISSVKIESLLSSVVDNRIRKRKRYGRAYILASDAGVRTYNPEVDNASTGIVFTEDFTGELKNSYNDNGEMTSAEVLVPFRFYDNKGNLLKITDFMVDGKIDTNKLPVELLNGFGYRIPTSGVNLMSNIKIVGFLPESYGDVVIAPADFTVQMGSDFDVDKMYSNTYATFYDSKLGKLTRLDQSHIKQKDDITEAINLLFKEIKLYSKYKGKKKADIIKELNNQIKVLRDTEIYKIKDLDILVLDNEITDIQRAVLNNVATEVQRARTKPLSFGRLPEMIKKFGLSFDTTYYSFLNRNVQDTSYLNGNLGKTAVGNFSLDMILNSLGQYIKTPVYFQHKVSLGDAGYKYVRTPIKAFGFVGNNINEPYLNDGSGRYKSDVLEGLMAAALDNGKEQILGKLGISDKTFDFIRAMVATGYNEEVIMGILAQPIMKLYLDPVTDSKVKAQMEQATRLIKKKTTFLEDTALDELTTSLYDYNIYKANLDEFGKALVKSVKDGTSESFSKTTQVAILTMYLAMESKGQSLSQVRSSLNVDSAGVGKNIIYSTAKLEQHEKTLENPSINNVESYFVNYKYNEETEKSEKDFVSIGNSALFYAARTNTKLWGKFFPFSNKTMEKVVKTIAKRTGKDIFRLNSYSDYATLVIRDFKSFLSAANLPKALPSFMKDMSNKDIYKSIILSSPSNQSLGEFILNLRENTSNSIKYSNDLLDGLDIDRIDNSLSTNVNPILVNIGYSNNKRIDNNEDNIVNAISEMINEPVDLGTWNGNPITSKDLANILIAYQLISRGVPGSNKFIQFIPTEQLRRLGYYESMSDNYRALLGFNSTSNSKANSAQFIMQHLQHNMADYYEPSADRTHKDSFENGVYVGENFKNMPTYIVFKEDGTYYAQHKTKTGFIRLNPLGWGPNTEYNHDVYNPVSINPDNNKSMVNVTTIEVVDNAKDVTAPFVNKALGNILINSSLGKQTVIDVVTGYNENTEEDITTEMKAYPITLTENGSTVDYFLVKNGNTYNSLYHPVTQYMIPINGLSASTTKVERDIKIMESLANLNPLDVEALGLAEEVETSNIAAIEANIKEFMTPSRDKSEDVFPDDINTVTREFADELGLSDTSLNLEDKYRLIFSRIIGTVGSSNKVLSYFLSRAADIIPLLSSTPIVLDTTLKAKGMYNSNGYIVINPNKFTTIEDMANVIAHEAIHGLFKKQVRVKNPIVKDLERFRKEVEAELVVEFGQEAIDNMKAKLKMGVPLTAGVEADLLYPILNVDELITGVLTNPAFQTYLNSKEMKLAKKSLWTKVLELMSSMLKVLGVKENSKLEDSLGAIFALTNDIRDNHLNNIPNPKYQRSLAFINERFNLVSNTNTLLPKGNAQQIVDFINSNFANTTATVVEGKYVEIIPTVFLSPSTTNGDLSSDVWDLEFINDEMDNTQASTKESKGNYYTYAASLRARVIQGEHILNKAKVSQDIIAIEEATNSLMEDKVSLINIRRIQSFADFAMRAKEDYAKVSAILDGPMNSEDITYARNILNFWKDVREYSFTSKHRESEQLMRTFGIIEDEAETAIKRLELIEKNYLEDFIKDTIGKDITLDDLFATYSDIDIVSSNVRDISTYDNDLLTSIWKRVQLANMEAETESETLLKSLNTIIDKVMPKLKAINSKDPYEIFRQLSENGLKTNHLINAYSSKFYSDRSRAYTLAKNGQDFATVNNYANWIKAETKAFKLSEYFPSGGVITPEVLANREALRQEVGDFAYNMWFNGQSKKLNSYNKRKDAIIATIKADNGMELSDDITSNPKALQAITNWSKKHSPYEFSNVVNNSNYKYQDGSDGIDGFSTYEILPNKPEHFNKDFEVIANDADLLEFYNEFSSIYESLKLHVPASQFANLIFGGLPVIEQSIYQAYSTKGLKGLFKGIKTAWANSITSTITKEGATELDLVTGDNSKQMFIPGIKSNSNAIKTYVNTKAIAYEVKTGSLPSQALLAQYREEAVNELANKGDFDLGKLMKVFGTLVIAHKQIASVENLIKIGQYTLNSYKENQFNSDGSIATRSGGGNAVLPAENSFPNTKKSFTYFINSQVYGNVKDEEMVFERKKYTAEEDELKASLDKSLQELEAKYEAGEVTETFYNSLKNSIVRNVDNLGKNVVGSKIGDNWLKYVQLKLMGWNILGGFSNSAFGFIGNMIEAAGEGSFTLSEMNEAYRMTASSVAKNLSFDKLKLGESGKIRSAMDKLNVLKEASHELYTSNEATSFGGKFKFASPYNMNQRTEYLNQAPLMIVMAKKTMVDTIGGRISIWDGMNADWEWDEATYGPMPTKVILDMRVAITKHIQRIHGNYDPASPLMIKKTIAGRAVSQFRTWLYEAVAVRFEKERMEHAIGTTVKGRYRTVGGLIFENEGRIGGLELTKEFSKALLNSFTFGAIKLKSFENTKLSDIDSQNMRKVAMELVLLLDVYILIALLKAGLSDDEDEAKGLYNVLLNQGTRLKSDLLLYINPIETRNILKDIIPAVSLFDDTVGFMKAVTNLEEDTVTTGVHQGNSKLGTATMKLLPGTSKFYSSYNAWSQIFDKDIKISKKDDNTEE